MLWSELRLILKTSSVTPDFFFTFFIESYHFLPSVKVLKKSVCGKFLDANVLNAGVTLRWSNIPSRGISRIFQRWVGGGGVTLYQSDGTHQIAFTTSVVGCLLNKGLQKGGGKDTPGTPLPLSWLHPWHPNTPVHFMLQKLEISTALKGHWACIQTTLP